MSSIDKSWIKLGNRNSPSFLKGLRNFIEIAENHVNSQGKACCPCIRCANSCRQDLETIYAHIHSHGFLQAYRVWNHHGEKYHNHDEIAALFARRTHPTTTNHEMFDVIDDVLAEQNTNEENINDNGIGLDSEFDALFKELNTELYPGCNWMSSLNFIAKLMHIKVINKWTDSSFDHLLEFLRVAFPKENHIPTSHYEAKKKLRKIGLGYESIHACVNDCFLFWKDADYLNNCPVCSESRWVDESTKGKKVPKKVLRYFPLTSRLRRRYSSRFTAKDMIWHNTGRSTDGKKPLPIEVDVVEGQYRFVGPNQSDFVRLISNQIWDEVPLCYKSWNDVPDGERSMIYPPLFEYFDLDSFRGTSNWGGIQAAITAECKTAYAQRKSKLKKHFIKQGGYDDVEAAINCPPQDYDVHNYHRAIDELFTTSECKERSEKNKTNRSKHRYTSYHGSQSYTQKRWKEKEKGLQPRYIEGFKDSHYKPSTGWANDKALSDYEKMKNAAEKMAENNFSDSEVDEIAAMKEALGKRRGHIRGIGRVVRNTDLSLSSYFTPSQTHWQQQLQEQLQEQQRQQQELQQRHQQELQQQLQQQQQQHEEEMRHMKEGIQKQIEDIRREFGRRD